MGQSILYGSGTQLNHIAPCIFIDGKAGVVSGKGWRNATPHHRPIARAQLLDVRADWACPQIGKPDVDYHSYDHPLFIKVFQEEGEMKAAQVGSEDLIKLLLVCHHLD